eukprot:TRINITY_DN2377_c0_g2_i1.p1 TRINITY_DN2377_c0_g2~~TRINITY_DN2377_c0_g2_i1.p1  ORF type:complete len:656 (+),score=166.30 TRINITY_DN2377_c0_g2_i1:73-1968(+)
MGLSGGKERRGSDSGHPREFPFAIREVATMPKEGQKPGTSGLRKKTRVFMQKDYLENFVQSVFDVLQEDAAAWAKMSPKALVVSGDGRYWNQAAIQVIIKMAVANGVQKVWVGTDGLLSTPAVSAVIRNHEEGSGAFGGFILSASHNPGGVDADFGIKYNCENGGPAPERITDAIAKRTTTIDTYKICEGPTIDIHRPGTTYIGDGTDFGRMATIEVFDCTDDHVRVLKWCFDFPAIKKFVNHPRFEMVYDCMNGVQGPYAKRVFCSEFGLSPACLLHADPLEDFGGPRSAHHGHADPNLKHAKGLTRRMGILPDGRPVSSAPPSGGDWPSFGAAADGDADRNMICGAQFFVSPSDSLAVICDNADCIPAFRGGLRGCARSMPTSMALDRVAKEKGVPCFEVPTGWKFFGNLMDSGNKDYFPTTPNYCPFLCGEESFGTGSNHVREKDGMWAVLAWLQILASRNAHKGAGDALVSVRDICREHWRKYGRNYYCRYDYEGVDEKLAKDMMAEMKQMTKRPLTENSTDGFELEMADMFRYEDPVDGSVSENQGIRWIMEDGSRIVFRLSGTGTAGATIRLYLEQYVPPDGNLDEHPPDVVKGLARRAMELSRIPERFGMATGADGIAPPTVIT